MSFLRWGVCFSGHKWGEMLSKSRFFCNIVIFPRLGGGHTDTALPLGSVIFENLTEPSGNAVSV